MSTDEQPDRASGSVPHAYRNALFWRWTPGMPAALPSAFVTLLYALGTAANPAGRLQFRDGKAIRIRDIAAAVKADEKDVRRYVDAAIDAGVLTVQGERKRGRASLYVLVLTATPDWGAAVASLQATRRKSRKPPPWMKNGGVTPELSGTENGGHAPELHSHHEQKERGTRPRMSSGDTPPFGSGDTPPNNPGNSQEVSHAAAEVVPQPHVDQGAPPETIIASQDQTPPPAAEPEPANNVTGFARCAVCRERMVPRPGRDRHTHCTPTTNRARDAPPA